MLMFSGFCFPTSSEKSLYLQLENVIGYPTILKCLPFFTRYEFSDMDRAVRLDCEFEASLVYIGSSKLSRAT